jgi:glucokinase
MTDPHQFRSTVLFTLGTEIGCRLVLGDLVLESRCGHAIIHSGPDARICACGQRGHLNAYCSGPAVVERTREALDAGRGSSLSRRLAAGQPLDLQLLAAEAEAGDPLALEIVMDTARYLAVGVVSMMNTVDPDGVLLGGEMTFGGHESQLGRRFLAAVREEVQRRAFPLLAARTVIEFAPG